MLKPAMVTSQVSCIGQKALTFSGTMLIRQSACMQASLQCSIVGSSIALLSGQKPAFRLLARAISLATGQPVAHIKPAVSEAFVVATPRVKSAQKVSALLTWPSACPLRAGLKE